MVQITKKGIEACKKELILKDVEGNLLNFYAEEKAKSIDENEIEGSSPQDLIDSVINRAQSRQNWANHTYSI